MYSNHERPSAMTRGSTAFYSALLLCAAAVLLCPVPAYASTPMGEVLCFILDTLVYGAGRGFATLGIVAIGVAAMLGKASWGLTATVAVGMAILFGCADIVIALGIGSPSCV